MLEASQHEITEWVTLTYAPQFLPTGGTLVPSHLSGYIRSLRQLLRRKLKHEGMRYFGVGEYGSKLNRPHYHVFLFGLPQLSRDLITRAWPYGLVYIAPDPVSTKLAEYTAGYTVKKEGKDEIELRGRHPEFSRMSLRPPIGARWAESLGESLAENKYAVESIAAQGDAPSAVRWDGKMVPLGRTLRRYVRKGLGWESELPDHVKLELAWLREKLQEDPVYVAEREKRREAGAVKARVRSTIYPKRETL